MKNKSLDVKNTVMLALFTALVVVFQCIPIKIATFELALSVPIMIIGAAVCGTLAGGWLGIVFSVVVLFLPGTAAYLTLAPFGTVLTVLVKGVAAGLVAGVCYSAFSKINVYVGALIAACCATLTNTGIFLIGSLLFFDADLATVLGVFISANFIIELIINLVLVPTVVRIIGISGARLKLKK